MLLEAAVSDFSESAEEDGPGEGIASFTFVETGMNGSAEIDALKPGEDEQGSLDAAQLAEGDRESVLARVAAQLAEHERSGHGALLDGSGETKDFVPVHPNCFEVDGATDHGRERPVLGFAVQQIQLRVAQVADARSEAEAEQMHEGEDVVREAGGVGVMLLDPQVGFMMKQPIENVSGVSHADVDDLGTERCVLVRDVCVEEFGLVRRRTWD